jgi:hypothetical protein
VHASLLIEKALEVRPEGPSIIKVSEQIQQAEKNQQIDKPGKI